MRTISDSTPCVVQTFNCIHVHVSFRDVNVVCMVIMNAECERERERECERERNVDALCVLVNATRDEYVE